MTYSRRHFHLPAMWGVCLLMLFLALDLPVFSVPVQPSLSIEEEYMERNITEDDMVIKFKWLKKNAQKILETVGSAASNIPAIGESTSKFANPGHYIMPVLQLAAILIPEANEIDGIRTEINALNVRFDNFNEQLKWAYNHYQIAIDNIENSWLKYSEMAEKKEMLEKIFFPFYTPLSDSALVIHRLLISDPVAIPQSSTTQSLGDVLAKRFRCHEKDVEAQFLYLMKLLCKGNMMDEKYYEYKGIDVNFRKHISQYIEAESASAMFRAQQRCVSNSKLYIKRDIIERIDDTKNHQQIANNIGDFLRRTYDRYDWMVVAFTSHFSRDLFEALKRHIFSGFTEVDRGTVTVAVASQIKGKYTKTEEVKQKIKTCLKDVPCSAVEKEIQGCKDVSDAYTAIHIFKNHNQTYISFSADENENDTYSASFASVDENQGQIYSGKCPVTSVSYYTNKLRGRNAETVVRNNTIELGRNNFGRRIMRTFGIDKFRNWMKTQKILKDINDLGYRKFLILIKSDEEMDGKHDPCKTFRCMNNGKCVLAPRTKIPMCECKYPHYGRRCENKMI